MFVHIQPGTWLALVRRRGPRWLQVGLSLVAVCTICLFLLPRASIPPSETYPFGLHDVTAGLVFNFFGWEIEALLSKIGSGLIAPEDTLAREQRADVAQNYIDALGKAAQLRSQITAIYSQAGGEIAREKAAPEEQALAEDRAWLDAHQDLVEGIFEEQVTMMLQEEGFGAWGFVWPPVKIRFTPLPLLLVTSDRAEITRAGDVHLEVDLSIPDRADLETKVDDRFPDKRSLVTPIGGLSAYPAMILETDSLVWLADTFAHEWTHHHLAFHPLGLRYSTSTDMTSINETTASIVGREVGRLVIQTYYPGLSGKLPALPTPPVKPPMSSKEVPPPEPPPPGVWDYDREMYQTRVHVDELLGEHKVEEAEAYMEQRREVFVEHGHNIRKLNQAYFAFYGSYATSPSVVNPIGGQLDWLRAREGSLRAFVRVVSSIRSDADLLSLLRSQQG
ncbi:MAG: hypothetical protein AB8I80_21370 [Anaerolineae bacterium]